jgi:hypothetical protein
MLVRRILVVTTACALAWVFSTTGHDSHADTQGATPGPALTIILQPLPSMPGGQQVDHGDERMAL